MRKDRFVRGGRGVFACCCCGRQTRQVDQGGDSECCPECFVLAGLDNSVNDGAQTWAEVSAQAAALLADAVSKGGDAQKAQAAFEYLWPKEANAQPQPGRITDPTALRTFVLGGNALFTIRSVSTGVRFTYRVRKSEDGNVFFVAVLTGESNETDYTYLGQMFANDPQTYRHGRKSRIGADAPSALGFAWLWRQLAASRLPASVECWHEGRCGRCGRTLTVPESVASGFGPECITRV